MEKTKKTTKKERMYSESEVLHILTHFAFLTDTHYMVRDFNIIREDIKKNHLPHLLSQV
jgi:hypothetical protein